MSISRFYSGVPLFQTFRGFQIYTNMFRVCTKARGGRGVMLRMRKIQISKGERYADDE